MVAERDKFSQFNFIHKQGDNRVKAYKSANGASGIVEGYLVTWGNSNDTDLQGEFFTPRTEFCLDWFRERPVLYHHGLDGETGLRKIGTIKSVETDDLGLWVQAQLDLRDRYAQAVYDMVKSSEFGWSSGSVDHLVKIADTGEIAVWPLIEGSITPTPAQPSKTMVRALKSGSGYDAPNHNKVFLPAPTMSYGAFKAVLQSQDGDEANHFLRGLEARVGNNLARTKSDFSFTNMAGETSMARNSAKRLARAYANAFGIKTDESDLDAIASEVEGQVNEEVAGRAAEELEMEAALSALEEEMILSNEEEVPMARSYRSSRRRRGYRSDDAGIMADEMAVQLEDELATQMDDIATEMADEIAVELEQELAMQAEQEAMEKAAARSLRRRAMRRALRQLEATDDVQSDIANSVSIMEGGTGESQPDYLGDFSDENPPIENFKRYGRRRPVRRVARPVRRVARRGYGYRADEMPIMEGEEAMMYDEAVMFDDAPVMSDELPVASRRYGRRRPVRRIARRGYGYRTDEPIMTDEAVMYDDAVMFEDESIMSDELPVASRRYGRRRPVRRIARRGYGFRSEDTAYNADDEIKAEEDAILTEEVAAASYRNGYRKGIRRAFRTTDDTGTGSMPDALIGEQNSEVGNYDEIPMDGASITTAETVTEGPSETLKRLRRRRAMRRLGNNRSRRGFRSGDADEATMADEEAKRFRGRRNMTEAEKEEEEAAKAFRRGYRSAIRRARRNTDEALMADPYLSDNSMLSDESYASEESIMMDEPVRRFGRRGYMQGSARNFRGKSAGNGYGGNDYGSNANYWKRRAMKAELSEAPAQRRFSSIKTTDVADRQGAYENAFKSYLYRGIGMMTDTEKYVLRGKGQVDWSGYKSHDSSLGVDPRVKTYFGGTNSSVGFAVPPDWVAELNKNVMTQTVMAPECRTRTTTSDRIIQPNLVTTDARRSHAAQVRWPGEIISNSSEHRSVEDQLTQVEVPIHVMLISLTAGNSALEDVTYSLEDEINEAFSEAVAIEYDELIWSGDGQGKMQGIVVNNDVVGTRSTSMQSVSGYIPTGSPDGIVTADTLKEMLFHLPRGYRQRAKWYMNSNTGLQIATLKDGNGNYLIDQRDESIQSVGVPDMLLGRPIVYNEYASDVEENAFPIVLGDLSRGYLIGKRVDFSIRRFDDSGYAELDQVLFLGRARLGGQVLQPASLKTLKVSAS